MSSSKVLRLSTLGLLYFVQGAPYGFQASSLPVMLRQEGVSFTQLGLMKMLFLPWVRDYPNILGSQWGSLQANRVKDGLLDFNLAVEILDLLSLNDPNENM